jgi:hypothetical protein
MKKEGQMGFAGKFELWIHSEKKPGFSSPGEAGHLLQARGFNPAGMVGSAGIPGLTNGKR